MVPQRILLCFPGIIWKFLRDFSSLGICGDPAIIEEPLAQKAGTQKNKPPPCMGPSFAATVPPPGTRGQSVSLQRNHGGCSVETLGHVGVWTAGQRDPAPWHSNFKNRRCSDMLRVVLSVLEATGGDRLKGLLRLLLAGPTPCPGACGANPGGWTCDLGQVTVPLQGSGTQEEQSLSTKWLGRLKEITVGEPSTGQPGTQ